MAAERDAAAILRDLDEAIGDERHRRWCGIGYRPGRAQYLARLRAELSAALAREEAARERQARLAAGQTCIEG